MKRSSSKRSRGYSSIVRKLLIWRCSLHSAHSRPNKQHLQKRQCKKCLQFLDYTASQEGAIFTYQACYMRLAIHSNKLFLFRTQGPQQSQRPHVHGRHRVHSHQQWSVTQHITDNKSSDVIGRRSQTWCIVHQCKNGSLHATHSQGNGTSTNLHPHTNQQLDCPHTTHQQNYAQGFKGHGHAIPLAALLQSTGPVSFLLETWNPKFGGLLDQASSSKPPQSFLATNPNIFNK